MKFGNPQTAIVEVITCTNTGRDILFFEMPQQYIGRVSSASCGMLTLRILLTTLALVEARNTVSSAMSNSENKNFLVANKTAMEQTPIRLL